MAKNEFDMKGLASAHWKVPDSHFALIEKEMSSPEPKDRMMGVVGRIPRMEAPDLGEIDWEEALAPYRDIEFPKYYLQPFHSVPGGYLSEAAATGDRQAMDAIYAEAHPRKCLGLRDEIAALLPTDAKLVLDLGGGTGDGGAAAARRLPRARVRVIDASPFMVTVGRRQNATPENLEFEQGFAEATKLPAQSVDAVLITLVFHECPDHVKREILLETFRILRPGGTLVLTDVPNDDLHLYRGFFEPYKEQWLEFDPAAALRDAGFSEPRRADVAERLHTHVSTRPQA